MKFQILTQSKQHPSVLLGLFLAKIVLHKKSNYCLIALMLLINVVMLTLISTVLESQLSLGIYLLGCAQIVLSIVLGIVQGLHLYHDLGEHGLDILIYAKNLTRKQIVTTKLGVFLLIGLGWTILMFGFNLILYGLHLAVNQPANQYLLFSFFAIFSSYALFGLISCLIVLYFNFKLAIILPLLGYVAGSFGGVGVHFVSDTSINHMATYLNVPNPNNDANNIVNLKTFYLNNNRDGFYIMPSGYEQNKFSERQVSYLHKAFDYSSHTSTPYQIFSWLSVPYQLTTLWTPKDRDLIDFLNFTSTPNQLHNYINYQQLESKLHSYTLTTTPQDLLHYTTANVDGSTQLTYLTPGYLKIQSQFEHLSDTKIIFARENVDSFDVAFPEDQLSFSMGDNLVGTLESHVIDNTLKADTFVQLAHRFWTQPDLQQVTKAELLAQIGLVVDVQNPNNWLQYVDDNTYVLTTNPDPQIIKNPTYQKIYLIVSLIYYLYYNFANSPMLLTLLQNDDPGLGLAPSAFSVQVDGYQYQLGGYSSYIPVQQTKDNKVIYRYQLNESNNFLFQPTNQVYLVEQKNQVVHKPAYVAIWLGLILIFSLGVYYSYYKKDIY